MKRLLTGIILSVLLCSSANAFSLWDSGGFGSGGSLQWLHGLYLTDLFNGYETSGYTITCGRTHVTDYQGVFQESSANILPISGARASVLASDGATLGAELITSIDNREFNSDTGFWAKGTGWTISGGVATHAGTAQTNLTRVTLLENYKTYQIQAYLSSGEMEGVYSGSSSVLNAFDIPDAPTTIDAKLTCLGTPQLFLQSKIDNTVLDNVSVKEIYRAWKQNKPNSQQISTWGDSTSVYRLPKYLHEITGRTIYEGGVGGEKSDQIMTRMLAATTKHADITTIWAGANDGPLFVDPASVVSNIASMVNALETTDYLVLQPLGNDTSIIGTQYRTNMNTIRAALSAAYGSRFLDVEQLLIDSFNPEIPQDVIDHGNGIVPSSLRQDSIHLTYAATKIVAGWVRDRFIQNGVAIDLYYDDLFASRYIKTSTGTKNKIYEITQPSAVILPSAVQYFKSPHAPATHTTVSVPIGTYTLYVQGSTGATVTATAGTAVGTFGAATADGTTGFGTPATITVTTAGTIVLTCAGTLTWGQLESSAYPTNRIPNGTTTTTRPGTIVSKSTSGIFPITSGETQNIGIIGIFNPSAAGQSNKWLWGSYTDTNNYTGVLITSSAVIARKRVGGTDHDVSIPYNHANGEIFQFAVGFTDAGVAGKVQSYSGGTWSAWSDWAYNTDATPSKLSASHQIGADGNGANQFFGSVLLLAPFKLLAQDNINKYTSVIDLACIKLTPP